MKKNLEIVVLVIWVCIGVSISWESFHLGIGGLNDPGSGLFPFLVGCTIISLSLLYIAIQLLRSAHKGKFVNLWPDRKGWKRIGQITLSLIGYAYFLELFGFPLCTFLLMMFYVKVVGHRRLLYSILVGLATSILSYLIFGLGFETGLPKGIIGL